MPIVTEEGFGPDAWRRAAEGERPEAGAIAPWSALRDGGVDAAPSGVGVEIEATTEAAALAPFFSKLALIAIPFAGFADGRGFSLARRLRDAGYAGRLRASGEILPDQFAYARQCGVDEVEISEARAARQPEADWRRKAVPPRSYRRKLATGAAVAG